MEDNEDNIEKDGSTKVRVGHYVHCAILARSDRQMSQWTPRPPQIAVYDCPDANCGPSTTLREDETLVELANQYELHTNQITEWKRQLVERASEVFFNGSAGPPVDLRPLHAKIGQHALEIDFLAGALDKAGLWSAKG